MTLKSVTAKGMAQMSFAIPAKAVLATWGECGGVHNLREVAEGNGHAVGE